MLATDRHNGHYGAAYADPTEAYRDVPILKPPTWKNEIATYFFLGGISGGASVIAALAELLGGSRLKGLSRTAHLVAFLTLLPCPPLLIMDLGVRKRFHHMLRIFKPSSPMNLGSWVLTSHGVVSTLAVMRQFASGMPLLGWLFKLLPGGPIAAAEVPLGLGLGGYTGVLIGTTSNPLWADSPYLGALFMASAMSTGTAAVSLAGSLSEQNADEREVLGVLGTCSSLVELFLLALYLATSGTAAKPLLDREHLALTLGGAATTASAMVLDAAATRAAAGSTTLTRLAALGVLAAGAMLRYSVVHAGHASAQDRPQTLRSTAPSPAAPGWGVR